MKVLIIGGTGMLGHKLVQCLSRDFEVFATVRGSAEPISDREIFSAETIFENIDVESIETVERVAAEVSPDYLINAVGIIKQLPSAKNAVKTITINSLLPHQLAQIAENHNARLISISTDCVFDGRKGMYSETDLPDATDLYGKSKNLGEVVNGDHLTIRTSIIGRELGSAHSLIEWFLSNRGKTVKGFANAIYSGFPTVVLAEIIGDLMRNHPEIKGLYHISSDPISKFDLLQLVRKHFDLDIRIERDEEFKLDRSLDSGKFRAETDFIPESWDTMIRKMADDKLPYLSKI